MHGENKLPNVGLVYPGLFLSTSLTPEGYAIESENKPGNVHVYLFGVLSLYDPLQSVYEAR